jgi:hypothetical protein
MTSFTKTQFIEIGGEIFSSVFPVRETATALLPEYAMSEEVFFSTESKDNYA